MRTQALLAAMVLALVPLPSVAQDSNAVLREWELLAKQGDSRAKNVLGLIYEEGTIVLQDYVEAARWYRLAAEQGNVNGQFNLGRMYVRGQGVVRDHILAHMWFNLAAANGGKKAPEFRELMAGEMLPADISEAQRRARVCMESNYRDCE